MTTIKVIFENDDYLYTKINGTREEIEEYYIGNIFNIGVVNDNLQKCVSIEFI